MIITDLYSANAVYFRYNQTYAIGSAEPVSIHLFFYFFLQH